MLVRVDREGRPALSRHARRRLRTRDIPPAVVALARRHGCAMGDPWGRGVTVKRVTADAARRCKALKGWVGLHLVFSRVGTLVTAYRDDGRGEAWSG